MPKQIGIHPFSGAHEGRSYYQSKLDGPLMRSKTGPKRNEVLNSNNFARTRENASEFQQAVQSATLLRHALRTTLKGKSLGHLNGHMNAGFLKVIKADKNNTRGNRHLHTANLPLLTGFEFNKEQSLRAVLDTPYITTLDATKAAFRIEIPALAARRHIKAPPGATHFKLISAAAAINPQTRQYTGSHQQTALLPLNARESGPLVLEQSLSAHKGQFLILTLGIEYFQEKPLKPATQQWKALEPSSRQPKQKEERICVPCGCVLSIVQTAVKEEQKTPKPLGERIGTIPIGQAKRESMLSLAQQQPPVAMAPLQNLTRPVPLSEQTTDPCKKSILRPFKPEKCKTSSSKPLKPASKNSDYPSRKSMKMG